MALLIAIIGLGGGFILATTALFVTTATAFGRRAILADLAIGFVLTTLIYLAFSRLLTLSLPAGPLERLFCMDTFIALANGMAVAIQPMNLLYALIGVLLGTAVGVLPGIGPALTVALLLPVTYKLDPGGSLIMFAGIYYGGMYGGSTTAILINTPGESASMATALEGNKMAKAGRGGPALATAAIGSFVAGTIATIGLAFLAPWLVDFAVNFGPEDYFALMCVAFVTVSATFGDSPIRGLTSLFIGLTLGLIGIDKLTGQARLAFGIPELLDGVEVTTLAVGLFAVGEALYVASRRHHTEEKLEPVRGSLWMTKEDWKRSWKPWLRGTMFGFPIGALARRRRRDSDISVLLHREAAHETSGGIRQGRHRRRRGTGSRQQRLRRRHAGAAADARASDLGHRRDDAGGLSAIRPQPGTAAVRRAARSGVGPDRQPVHRQRHAAGAQPAAGRPVGETAGDPAALALRRHSGVRDHGHHRGKTLGGRAVDAGGFWRDGLSDAPVRFSDRACRVGLILGPIAESQLRRAMSISLGDPMALLQSPMSATLLAIALIALVAPFVMKGLGRFKANED